MRKKLVLILAALAAVAVSPSAANAGPCGALGSVCTEIIHRPMNQLCGDWDYCPD